MDFVRIHDPRKPGDYLVLAKSAYDAARHRLYESDLAPAPAAATEPPASDVQAAPAVPLITAVNAEQAKARIADAPDRASLEELLETELRGQKPRSSVVAAARARLAQLAVLER